MKIQLRDLVFLFAAYCFIKVNPDRAEFAYGFVAFVYAIKLLAYIVDGDKND